MDLSMQAVSTSMTLYHILDMNTALLDLDGSILLLHEHDQLPDFLMDLQLQDLRALSLKTMRSPNMCNIFTNAWGLSYLSVLFRMEGEADKILCIGPFLKQVPDTHPMDKKFQGEPNKFFLLQNFYRTLKLISSSKIQSIANMLEQAGSLHQAPLLYWDADEHPSQPRERDAANRLLQQPDENAIELIELRYKLENELMHAVEKGDRLKIKEMQEHTKNLYDFSERFPNQPVRALRNTRIVLNTLLRVAAKNGKVPPFYLHQLSEKFSKQIERSESIDALIALSSAMFEEYCDLVKRCSAAGYSPVVQQAMQYLMVHYRNPLDLKSTAKHSLVHPSHLSRQFKKETGMTLTGFLNKQRIEEAKHLLKKERASVDWIAGYVGFEDAGYFTRVFKKLVGMTPREYRG